MDVVAIVPARGGSKGIPRKNLREVAGCSLVGWAIRAGKEAHTVRQVIVSSDDSEILEEALRYDAMPLRRPPELSRGEEGSLDRVLSHAAYCIWGDEPWLERLIVTLQPSVPVRARGLVDFCVEALLFARADCVLTAYPLHFVWRKQTRRFHNGDPTPARAPWVQANARGRRPNRQTMLETDLRWHEDGAVFVTRAGLLQEHGCRVGGQVEVVPNIRSVDIDTEEDLAVADAMLRERMARPPHFRLTTQHSASYNPS